MATMLQTVESSLAGAIAPVSCWSPDAMIEEYLLAMRPPQVSTGLPTQDVDAEAVAAQVFDVLTKRDYCYLSKSRVAPYRPGALAIFRSAIERRQPIHFFFDLGGGYHASLRPGVRPLDFSVGLAEWFALGQIARFLRSLAPVYAPGARFTIVIDNLCAYAVNEIPVAETERYCGRLRALIRAARLDNVVDLLVESEQLQYADYVAAMERAQGSNLHKISQKQIDNVQRFLGRPCDADEAQSRTERYLAASFASDTLVAPLVTGLRMTQRASANTLCFRPFPGADCRIQAGQVVLHVGGQAKVRPMLLTSANVDDFDLQQLALPHLLPFEAPSVMVACPRLM